MISCKKETNYTLAKNQVGIVTNGTQIKELADIFKNDSLVSHLGQDNFAESTYDEYLVYDRDGNHLLTFIPKHEQDSSSTIDNVQVFDKRYKTVKGLSIKSKFKDINDNYTIDKVQSTFSNAVLFIDELNATITIDKEELGFNDFGTQKISKEQIPDLAKIKGFTLWFD
ncbi:MAG: hypothetical protein CR989_02935 [Flavobacteriales bacterium]|nr:MAG: hypothetical protein CR989_02935 [Flavobacteriales bacterium]